MQEKNVTAKQFSHIINQESGLLGISETNSDMRELMNIEYKDERAKDAIELFCYQAKNGSAHLLHHSEA